VAAALCLLNVRNGILSVARKCRAVWLWTVSRTPSTRYDPCQCSLNVFTLGSSSALITPWRSGREYAAAPSRFSNAQNAAGRSVLTPRGDTGRRISSITSGIRAARRVTLCPHGEDPLTSRLRARPLRRPSVSLCSGDGTFSAVIYGKYSTVDNKYDVGTPTRFHNCVQGRAPAPELPVAAGRTSPTRAKQRGEIRTRAQRPQHGERVKLDPERQPGS
jgi:hypothetical protein